MYGALKYLGKAMAKTGWYTDKINIKKAFNADPNRQYSELLLPFIANKRSNCLKTGASVGTTRM